MADIQKKFKIYLDPASSCARSALKASNMMLTPDVNCANILWLRKGYQAYYNNLRSFQWLNHFPNETNLSNKGKLTENLKQYDTVTSSDLSISEFYQESYCLYDKGEIYAFLDTISRNDTIWILKPNTLSKGRGIKIVPKTSKFSQLLSNIKYPYQLQFDNQAPCQYIAQRYIKNPLLLNNRKSEIRIYWLITSLNPLVAFVYSQGTVRLNSEAFQLANFDNPLIHITNIYQQKKYNKNINNQRLKWSFDELDQYLYLKNITQEKNFSQSMLIPKIKQILFYVLNATKNKLNNNLLNEGYFGLYGADFILDSNLQPWLTEIQKGPGLSWSDPIKKGLIPPMLNETIQIISEIAYKKRLNQSLTNLSSIQNFQYLVNEA
ncbi:tubulin--tyrosine ligase family protein [Thiotrichales bacterium 19S3-7]|nr:tubulin--tyrosine ligase family protein [Thiotrichales bacterium 19S3-7]MCF6801399.1 tubulin--tyrosine ligase family protein [Thiotrichales bacterium 19S3-11]